MVLINYYSHLDAEKETKSGNFKTVQEAFPGVDFTNCIIIRSGKRIEADTPLGKDEIIFIRKTPSSSAAAALVVAIVSAVVAVAGIGVGIASYIKNKRLQRELEEAQKSAKSSIDEIDALPFLRGANNQAAIGRSFPLILGEHYHTPYRLTPKYYEVSGVKGENEYCNIILEAAYSPLVIEKILIGETPIYTNLNKTKDDALTTFPSSSIYYDPENIIEIKHSDDFQTEAFKKKIVSDYIQTEIENDYGTVSSDIPNIIHTAQPNAKAIDVCILFDGLRKFSEENWTSQSATINCWWSNVDEPDPDNATHWHEMTFNQNGTLSNTFNYNSKKQMRFLAHKEFSPSESLGKTITVKLKRTTPCEESSSQEKCYLAFINTEVYDALKSSSTELVSCKPLEDRYVSMCTRIGIRMKASQYTEDLSDSIHIIAYGCARTWDGNSWSETKTITRNPAAWALEILTSDIHNVSKYADSEIDMESCGSLYEYCEENNFYCDAVITEPITKENLLTNILVSCNATLIYNNDGLLEFCFDDEELYPVALLNTQDVIDVTITKKLQRGTDGRKITFVNRDSWTSESAYYMYDGTNEHGVNDVVTEMAPSYVTTYEHAVKLARRNLAIEKLQPREVVVNVGLEGGYYPLYSCVDVQLPQLSVGITSAIIKSLSIQDGVLTEIELDQNVDFEDDVDYGIIAFVVKNNERGFFTAKVSGTGKTNILEVLDYDGTSPIAGNIVSFGSLTDSGSFAAITTRMKIYGIKRDDNGFKLTLKDYNASIYDDSAEIPEYHSNATISPTAWKQLETVSEEVRDALDEQQEQVKEMIDSIGVYTFDVTPEYQTAPVSSDGAPIGSQSFRFSATVYRSSRPYEGSVTYSAKFANRTVGTWANNVLTLDNSVLSSDNNEITIKAVTADGYSFEALVTIAKLYAGDAGDAKYTVYEIGLSEPFIKTDSDGLNPDPSHIIPKKLKKTEAFQVETNYGYITASVDGAPEEVVDDYHKVLSTDVYSAYKDYFFKATPFYMTLEGNALTLNDIILIGFNEE